LNKFAEQIWQMEGGSDSDTGRRSEMNGGFENKTGTMSI
jgi:hypothetical protein